MIIRTVDGVAFYAKYLLRAGTEAGTKIEGKDEAAPFRIRGEGVYCFDDAELTRAESYLAEHGVEYKLEKLPVPTNWRRTEGVKYASLEEVMAHLEQGIEPESMTIPRLRERMQAAESRAEAAEDKAEAAEIKAQAAEQRAAAAEIKAQAAESRAAHIDTLEARLQSLEKAAKEVGVK